MTDETINAEQCAELLHCTEQRIEELTRSGELPGMKFGRGWIYVKADLLAYIADRARKEAEERRQDLNARKSVPQLLYGVQHMLSIPKPMIYIEIIFNQVMLWLALKFISILKQVPLGRLN